MRLTSFEQFLRWEQQAHQVVAVKLPYIDVCEGDISCGMVLSQIIFWHLPGRDGTTRLRVQYDGHLWLVCQREDWWDQTRLNARQIDRILGKLEEMDLIVKVVRKFKGFPTLHLRINDEVFLRKLVCVINEPPENPYHKTAGTAAAMIGPFSPNGENRSHETVRTRMSPNGENVFTDSVRTEKHLNTKTTDIDHPETTSYVADATGEKKTSRLERDFLRLMDVWPTGKRKKIAAARKVWETLRPSPDLVEMIIEAVIKFKSSVEWTRGAGQFIPGPDVWLRNKQWTDEMQYPAQIAAGTDQDRPVDTIEARRQEMMARMRAREEAGRSDHEH